MKKQTKKIIRKSLSLDEEKFEYLEKIRKDKKIKSFTGVIEYLIDHHQNRLSNKIARDIENISLILLLNELGLIFKKDSNGKLTNLPANQIKRNLKNLYKLINDFEKLKVEVLAEIKKEKEEQKKKELEKVKKELKKIQNS